MTRWWMVMLMAAGAAAAGSRLPRTSQSAPPQQSSAAPRLPQRNLTLASRSTVRNREQYIFNVFEVIVSTLETKLQRIENLDKAVEHLMRRVEALDSRVNDNILKTDAIISKLGNLDLKLFSHIGQEQEEGFTENTTNKRNEKKISDAQLLDRKLESLDQKVSDIDTKLVGLKNQIDNNFLPVDDINAEASERKPINLNVIEIAKGLNTEVVNEITKEVDQLRSSVSTVDRKLQFHINLVSENLGKVLYMMADVHAAIVEPEAASINVNSLFKNRTASSTPSPVTKSSKIDTLVNKIIPMMSVSEKMDEVWDVVVGTKSSVDDLVPKSDELLTQTQRQERAIGQIHNDLRVKTNLIIENLDMVEKRLKKQEDDVATLAQRPVPAELLLDPTIDRLVEYAPNRYRVEEPSTDPTTITVSATTMPPFSTINNSPSSPSGSSTSPSATSTPASTGAATTVPIGGSTTPRLATRKGGIIFPSVKNKPIIGNNTFASEIVANYKDVKGYSCVDLLNAGMRESGVYYLQIRGTTYWFLKVFCEQNVADGGWTVIHRRDDYGQPAENFNRDWSDYKNGFGDPSKEFWLGNENIYMLTNNDDYMLRVELEDFDGNKRYAQYSHFKIYSEAEYYKLEIEGYEGTAGDSLNDPWYGSNNSPFSTYNRDNDRSSLNCASMLKGGWWWKSCGRGLNGLYLHDPQDLTARQGIVWFRWRGWDYTLKRASMMIKPKGLQPNT
ncbi:angiopoietin-related protein 2 isoform X1 [Bombyx mandarina]|uniref:Fibrinogen C-terminal domain-containing protein n=3 Tax=Bombyx TaxID=7090 RepID=A0A8R2AQ15_BOMMO|nr:angiopoietin-related protein 2 [Bombyx mori]XP_028042877.1 angiopoietin-related protein 2 isoform X1 [Bombyx mandarina]